MTRACGHCRPTKAWNHKNDTIYLPLGTTQMIRSGVTPDKRSTRTIPSFKVTLECFRIRKWQFSMSKNKLNLNFFSSWLRQFLDLYAFAFLNSVLKPLFLTIIKNHQNKLYYVSDFSKLNFGPTNWYLYSTVVYWNIFYLHYNQSERC